MPRVRKGNRTDMNVPNVPTGLPYGERAKLEAAQSVVPVPTEPPPVPTDGPGATGPAPAVDWKAATESATAFQTNTTPLDAPTERPNEPVTAGLGAAEAPKETTEDVDESLRALLRAYPLEELASIVAELD